MIDGNGLLDFAKVVIGAGLGSGVASIGLAWWKHRGDGRYLAMRLAVIFEAYASACSSLISANGMADQLYGEEFPNWNPKLPTLPDLPPDADGWKALDSDDASTCLGFPSQIAASQSVIGETAEYAPYDLDDVIAEEACGLGLAAWEAAQRLRSAHNLKPPTMRIDYVEDLKDRSKRLAENKAEQANANVERSAAIAAEIEPDVRP